MGTCRPCRQDFMLAGVDRVHMEGVQSHIAIIQEQGRKCIKQGGAGIVILSTAASQKRRSTERAVLWRTKGLVRTAPNRYIRSFTPEVVAICRAGRCVLASGHGYYFPMTPPHLSPLKPPGQTHERGQRGTLTSLFTNSESRCTSNNGDS